MERQKSPCSNNFFTELTCSPQMLHCNALRNMVTSFSCLQYSSFNIFRCDRLDDYAGSAIAVHSSLKSKVITLDPILQNRFTEKKVNIVGVELLKSINFPSISIWSCYVPSDTHIPTDLWQLLFNFISPSSLLCGDFNSFHPSWGSSYSSSRGTHIYDTVNSLGLCILNNGNYTHIGRPGSSNSAIDLSFSSPDLVWNTTWFTLDDPNGRDHIPILITINSSHNSHSPTLNLSAEPSFTNSLSFNLNKADWPSFSHHVQSSISSLQDTASSTISYTSFIDIINQASITSIPVKKNLFQYLPSFPSLVEFFLHQGC